MEPSLATFPMLTSDEGTRLLLEASLLPTDPLTRQTRLRKRYSVEIATAAVELLELRKRAATKFIRAESMFFTREGLEQSTGERIAAYRASCFPSDVLMLDACCGIGGDALALAKRGSVLAVDVNPAHALFTNANAKVTETAFPVVSLCADVTSLDLDALKSRGGHAAFFDPSRRTTSATGERRRVRNGSDYSPSLGFAKELASRFDAVAVKLSPALEDEALEGFDADLEFISERGECKEAVLWFNDLKKGQENRKQKSASSSNLQIRRATILLPNRPPETLADFVCEPPLSSPILSFLYEPDPAILRAGLVSQLAVAGGFSPVNLQSVLLTADDEKQTSFAHGYRVRETLPFNVEKLKRHLKMKGWRVEVIKKRHLEIEPEVLRRQMNAGNPEGDPVTLFVFRQGERMTCVICDLFSAKLL